MQAKIAPTIQKQPIENYKFSFSIKPAVFQASGWADPPPAEHPIGCLAR
jgi:hypothetical protein